MFFFRKFTFQSYSRASYAILQLLACQNYNSAASSVRHACSIVEGHTVTKQKSHQLQLPFSTIAQPILVQARDPSRLALEIVNAVDEHRYDDAWKTFEKHMHMDGLPRSTDLNKLIVGLAESFDAHWLNKCCSLVELVFNGKEHELLAKETLIYLSFILARFELPIPASNVLRKLVQIEEYPPVKAWSGIIGHIAQTATGAFLAAELIMEIGYLFKDNRVDPRKKSNRLLLLMKPDSFVFNIALTSCLLFGTTRKAEQLLELMPRVGVKPDANLLIVMARIYEKNGRRDEINKLKRHIDEACGLGDLEFQLFYDCLLSCHLKFGDLSSATDVILDMLRKGNEAKRSLAAARSVLEVVETRKASSQNSETEGSQDADKFKMIKSPAPSYMEFMKDRNFSRLDAEAKESLHLLSDKLQAQIELVKSEHGILQPTEKIYAKLVKGFLEAEKIPDLAAFLIKVNKEETPVSIEKSAAVQVINACISLGLLDQAHDLLDEMRFSGIRVGSSVYSSLLKAYCRENRQGEIEALLRDARKAGIQLDSSCYEALIQTRVHHKDSNGALHLFKEMKEANINKAGHREFDMLVEGCAGDGETGLMAKLLEEIKYSPKVDSRVHDWNSVIHFFCKKRMMHDAQKAFIKMRAIGHSPNAQTFHSLVTAYAAIGGKYVEVTDLWGEMKVLASLTSMKFDQELLDSLLYCFVRGGFFLRAMEVIEMMEKRKMFIDKYKYRSLWLKYHRTMYKGKPPKVQTEAQYERREAALAFKKWIGLT